ncbi:hypothetical protein C8R44DRAFT_740398 [Mycena epipterygia]|nr:hypothetical protein C8R44DRAFT_740398 [Mycena epipterygia]
MSTQEQLCFAALASSHACITIGTLPPPSSLSSQCYTVDSVLTHTPWWTPQPMGYCKVQIMGTHVRFKDISDQFHNLNDLRSLNNSYSYFPSILWLTEDVIDIIVTNFDPDTSEKWWEYGSVSKGYPPEDPETQGHRTTLKMLFEGLEKSGFFEGVGKLKKGVKPRTWFLMAVDSRTLKVVVEAAAASFDFGSSPMIDPAALPMFGWLEGVVPVLQRPSFFATTCLRKSEPANMLNGTRFHHISGNSLLIRDILKNRAQYFYRAAIYP